VPISTAATVAGTMFIVSPGYLALAAPRMLGIVVLFLAGGAVAFGIPYALAGLAGLPAAGWLALIAGLGLYAFVVTRMPAEREIAARLLAALPRPGLRAAPHR
jgi:hypothetical protein